MTAEFWTTKGSDIWRLKERRVFDFENLETKEVVTCDVVTEVKDMNFTPVIMPKVKKAKVKKAKSKSLPRAKSRGQKVKKVKVKKKTAKKAAKSSRWGPKAKSKYKGVSRIKKTGRWRVQCWDKAKGSNIALGTFDSESELLAAAAYQEHIGDKKEARRLRNEYQEGNCRPEASEPQAVHKRMFPENTPKSTGQFPSEV